jgi:hypothetical protein
MAVACTATTIQYNGPGTQCTATAHYSDGTSTIPTSGISWQASTPVAIINASGFVTVGAYTGSVDTVVITATYQQVSGTITLTVKSCNEC